MNAVIFTKDHCIYCTRAKELLKNRNISYEERILDVHGRDDRILTESQSWVTKDELLIANPAAKTVPQIWIDGKHIGGFTELDAWIVEYS